MPVHHALRKVIALHPVLMRGTVREIVEGRLSKVAVFQPPVVLQMKADPVTDRPVVVFAFDWVVRGCP